MEPIKSTAKSVGISQYIQILRSADISQIFMLIVSYITKTTQAESIIL
jgi:hypothetical protein